MNSGAVFAVFAALLWGVAYTIDQRVLGNASALGLFLFDVLLGAIVLLPVGIRCRDDILSVTREPRTLVWAIAALAITLGASYCILAGIKRSNATIASVIEIAYPCIVALLSVIVFRQVPNTMVLMGGIVTLIGVATVVVGAAR